jgi:cysteinyl-tRNA synthetase
MGKSYNNQIKLTEMFSGDHQLLEKGYSPMTIRFFILQTHYRSTLDFSNEALQAAEKGLNRLMDAHEWLQEYKVDSLQFTVDRLQFTVNSLQMTDDSRELDSNNNPSSVNYHPSSEKELNQKIIKLLGEFEEFINDDFNTAKVLANMFEIVPVINSLKDKSIAVNTISPDTVKLMQQKMKMYIENILGLKNESSVEKNKLKGVVQVLIGLRKEAREKKDWMTSDKIRNQLAEVGVLLKDEKNGEMSWNVSER